MSKETGYGLDRCQKEYGDRHPVQHKKGSAKRPKCGCGSWLNHWKIYNKLDLKSNVSCSYMGCSAPAEDGAHVVFVKVRRKTKTTFFKPQPIETTVYIIPLCGTHNRSRFTEPFFVHAGRYLIDDAVREECSTVKYRLNRQNYFHVKVGRAGSKPKCGCSSHIQHYWNYTQSSRTKCVAMPCKKDAVVAAPVTSLDKRTRFNKFTAPLCRYHGRPGRTFFVKRNAELCPPDLCDECGGS
ncbi:MAG: hypothetical protein GJ676_03225 [Rhodobacteraceae bacterium]|nr:hypothetical protein [Paracoccaceae bacterium]